MSYLNKIKESLMRNKSIRNGALFSIFSFVNKGFSFLLLIIIANLMSPAEYGYLNLFNTIVMVIGFFVALSSEGYMSVAYFQQGEKGVAKTFSSVLFLSLVISSLCVGCIWLGGTWLSDSLKLPYHILFITVAICFFTVYNNIFLDMLRIKERVWKYGFFSCSCALANFIVSIILIKYCEIGWVGRAYAQVGCIALFGFIGLWFFFANGYFTRDIKTFVKPLLLWSIPLIPHAATNFIRQGLDRYIIDYFHSIDDVGLFSLALTLVNVITMIGFGFNQSNSVDIYKTLSSSTLKGNEKAYRLKRQRKMIMLVYVVSTIIAVAAMAFAIPIFMPKYIDSIKYFLILSVYGFGVCIYLLYTNYLFYYKCTRQIMFVTFGTAVLHLLLSMTFTRYGLIWTSIIYSISQVITIFGIRYYALKELKNKLN